MSRKRKTQLKTRRLFLRPFTEEELRTVIDRTEEDLKAAYNGMLEAGLADPANRLWIFPWSIRLKKENTEVGSIGFHGPVQEDAVEIGYGIDEAYRNKGYAAEAAKAMIKWAFTAEGVYFVEAESEADNKPSLKVLDKLKFTEYADGEEGPRFYLEKPASDYGAFYIALGMAVGAALGRGFMGSTTTGMCVGLAIGSGIGIHKENREKEKLNAAWARRNARLSQQNNQ